MLIGELSERTEVSSKAIRYYETIGLLAAPMRKPSGYRVYDEAAVGRLRFIRTAQSIGLSLLEPCQPS